MSDLGSTRGRWFLGIAISSVYAFSANCANAQIVPDGTLPNNSIVTPVGSTSLLEGGTQAGSNLFHSFQQFSVPNGGTAFFNNAVNIQNIISRVTGGSISNIDGLIRANGSANLFLLNPNGIVFGENASLNVGGSFVGSTANAIQFGNLGIFSADTPNAPSPLLTINPSALLFNQPSTAAITNRSTAPAGPDPAGVEVTGLRVPDGRSLLLVGGNVFLDGGSLRAYEGLIELAGLANRGTLGLNVAGNILSLSVPEGVERADVSLTNGAQANVRAAGGGSIAINARNFLLAEGSILRSGIESGLSASVGNAGDIEINATGETTLTDGSFIASVVQPEAVGNAGNINITTGSLTLRDATLNTSTSGQGDGGRVFVQASGMVDFANSNIFSDVNPGAVGNSGAISITAGSLSLTDSNIFSNVDPGAVGNSGGILITAGSLGLTNGAQLQSSILGADASLAGGRGSAGEVNINVRDRVTLAGANQNGLPSSIFTDIEFGAEGNGGNITISSGSLSVRDGAELDTSTAGQGNGGNIIINARDTVTFDGVNSNGRSSRARTSLLSSAEGTSGDIRITTGSLFLSNGAFLYSSTFGKGDAGNITINARDTISFDSGSFASSIVAGEAVGKGGDIQVTTGSLSLTNGSQLSTSVLGQGDAGNITIDARDTVTLDGIVGLAISSVQSRLFTGAGGKGGDIRVTTGSLRVTNGALLSTTTDGTGNAGNITINARDTVTFDGVGNDRLLGSNASSDVGSNGIGNGGDIRVSAYSLLLKNGGQLAANSFGSGNAGNITIDVRDTVTFDGIGSNGIESSAITFASENGSNGGDIQVTTGTLSLTNGGQLSTFASRNAGNITINARDVVNFDGISSNGRSSSASSELLTGNAGNAGDIFVTTGSLSVTNGAQLVAITRGSGDAGNIQINATDSVSVFGTSSITGRSSALFTLNFPESTGKSGDITVNTSVFRVSDGAVLDARTRNDRNGGNITVNARQVSAINGGQLLTTTSGAGSAGKIIVNATDSVIVNGSDATFNDRVAQFGTAVANPEAASGFFVRSESTGSAGEIEVTSPNILLDNSGRLIAESASGNGGNITLQVGDLLLLRRGSLISATAGTAQQGGDGGNITINAPSGFIVAVSDEDSNIIANAFSGSGGRVDITTRGIFGIQPRLGETPLSDITASSQLGVNGEVSVNTPIVDFSLGLVELPTAIADSGLIDTGCGAPVGKKKSEFIFTGRGGLPPSPDEPLTNDVVWSDTRLRAIAKRSSEALNATQNRSETPAKPPLKPEAVAIVPATGWVSNNRGEVTLISHASNATSLGSTPTTCPQKYPKNYLK